MKFFKGLALLALMALFFTPIGAMAQEAVATVPVVAPAAVDAVVVQPQSLMSQIVELIMPVLGLIITALISWAALEFKKKTGIDIDKNYQDTLQKALASAVRYGLQRASWVPGDPMPEDIFTAASEYLRSSIPDTLTHFGLSNDSMTLEKLLRTHLPTVNPATAPTPDAVKPSTDVAVKVDTTSTMSNIADQLAGKFGDQIADSVAKGMAAALKKAAVPANKPTTKAAGTETNSVPAPKK